MDVFLLSKHIDKGFNMIDDEILNKVIKSSLNLTDALDNMLEVYYDLLEYQWNDIGGVKEIVSEDIIGNQITIIVEDDKINELKKQIKNNGWTVHQGRKEYNNRLTIRWGNLP